MSNDAGQVPDNSPDAIPDYDGTQTGGPVRLSIAQAAELLGVNERTIRRRMAKPENLPSGWTVDSSGHGRTIVVHDSRALKGQGVRVRRASPDTEDGSASAPGNVGQELVAMAGQVAELKAQVSGLEATVTALQVALTAAHGERDWLRARIVAAEDEAVKEREERERLMRLIPIALPPARSWWQRLLGGRDPEDG